MKEADEDPHWGPSRSTEREALSNGVHRLACADRLFVARSFCDGRAALSGDRRRLVRRYDRVERELVVELQGVREQGTAAIVAASDFNWEGAMTIKMSSFRGKPVSFRSIMIWTAELLLMPTIGFGIFFVLGLPFGKIGETILGMGGVLMVLLMLAKCVLDLIALLLHGDEAMFLHPEFHSQNRRTR